MSKKNRHHTGVMDVCLFSMAVFLLVFIIVMILVYIITGGIPDTLVTCVFAVSGTECGILGWIKTETPSAKFMLL